MVTIGCNMVDYSAEVMTEPLGNSSEESRDEPLEHQKQQVCLGSQVRHESNNCYGTDNECTVDVNMNCLCPESPLKIELAFDNYETKALIDTGATLSLIRYSTYQHITNAPLSDKYLQVEGFNNTTIETLGSVVLPLKYFGSTLHTTLEVTNDTDINYPLIFGMDFLQENNVVVSMAQRRLTRRYKDDSLISVYLKTDDTIKNIIYENIPLYNKEKCVLTPNEIKPLKITTNASCLVDSEFNMLYLEGRDGLPAQLVNGIVEMQHNEHLVYIKADSCKKNTVIKAGETVAHGSTLLTMEVDETDDEQWSLERLKSEIKLNEHLTSKEHEAIYEMLLTTRGALSLNSADIGRAMVKPHHIELTDKTPIWQKHRNFSEPINLEVEKQCQELLASDIIEFSNSDWSSPIVPVRKTDGTLRMCVDYRKVNKVTKTQQFPMPNLIQDVYKGHNIRYFTRLDLVRGYYQVPLDEESREITAFSTSKNHYHFKRLSFGLKNSGFAFQKTMQQILSSFMTENVVIYIDDILIMNETFDQHLDLVSKILHTLYKNNMKIKVSKCEFFQPEVCFLGHIISKEGIAKSPKYVKKVKDFQRPTTVTDLRKFLGFVNFQRIYIPHCSSVAKPLSEITGRPKRHRITWTEDRVEAFEKLKAEVAKDITLTYPDYGPSACKLELFVDASGLGAGACLVQMQDGHYKTIGHASMTFSAAQSKYSTIERELTAIRFGIIAFRCFIYGVNFIVYTDHKPLIYLHNMAVYSSRLQRTLDDLAEYNFSIKYKPGSLNVAADLLSRLTMPVYNDVPITKNFKDIPKGFQILTKVDGGGDSLFESMFLAVQYETDDEFMAVFPDNFDDLRTVLVNELVENASKYNFNSKSDKKLLKLMFNSGQQPCCEVILAACQVFNLEIHVYHGMPMPVVYKRQKSDKDTVVIYLQCISLCHYNPIYKKKSKETVLITNERYLNMYCELDDGFCDETAEDSDEFDINFKCNVEYGDQVLRSLCPHTREDGIERDHTKICCLIDTGAEVSILSKSAFETCKEFNCDLELLNCTSKLCGLRKEKTSALGYVNLNLNMLFDNDKVLPFAVVEDSSIPCCLILGANFLLHSNTNLDCGRQLLLKDNCRDILDCSIKIVDFKGGNVHKLYPSTLSDELEFSSTVDGHSECESLDIDYEPNVKPKFVITNDQLLLMQNGNYAVRSLRTMIAKQIVPKHWKIPALKQFKRHYKTLQIRDELVVKGDSVNPAIVVTYPFLVEIVYKVHNQLAHIGRHKVINVIDKYFWHPAIDSVAREICASCRHCQLFKPDNQSKIPPTLKIQSHKPFDLVAIDLLQFIKSKKGNIALLVLIDHFSKFLAVVPIKNKKSQTIADSLKHEILPLLPSLPMRLLSDNGTEFRGSEFERVLSEFQIEHIYSTPYMPTSNGCVERSNRTIIEMLKGLGSKQNEWDQNLSILVITYNNTVHSQTKLSPSECIMSRAYEVLTPFPIHANIVDKWQEGHPNFCPYRVNQKVLKKIVKVGNKLEYKLGQKFEGPYVVAKVYSNKLTYELCKEGEESNKVIKAHYKQLRPFKQLSPKVLRYVRESLIEGYDEDKPIQRSPEGAMVTGRREMPYLSDFTETSDVSECSESEEVLDQINNKVSKEFRATSGEQLDLCKFKCSERISNTKDQYNCILNSSPKDMDTSFDFSRFLNENEQNISLLMALEDSLNQQERLLNDALLLSKEFHDGSNEDDCIDNQIAQISKGEGSNESIASGIPQSCEISIDIQRENVSSNAHDSNQNVKTILSNNEIIESSAVSGVIESCSSCKSITSNDLRKHPPSSIHGSHTGPETNQLNKSSDVNNRLEDRKSFEGFPSDRNHSQNLLKDMRTIIAQSKKKVIEGRRRSRDFRLEALRNLSRSRYLSISGLDEQSMMEGDDVLTDLPQSTPRRVLRSQGSVDDVSNVQRKTIEYKTYEKKMARVI